MRRQRTIARAAQVRGFGYWSGENVCVEFRPAAAGTGLNFVRRDLHPPVRVPALLGNRVETPRRTTLMVGQVTVQMVEHLLAACAGLGIDNCEIWVDRPEMPGGDGSSWPFVEALLEAGLVEQQLPRARQVITAVTRVGDSESWVEARPGPGSRLWVSYQLDYGADSPIGRQAIQLDVTPLSFQRELARARTFLLREEADWLRRRGLGQRVSYRDLLVFDQRGPVNNELRFPDECVRHKTLDLIGDLALAGCDLEGQIVAHRSGHRLNAELVRALTAEVAAARRKSA